MAGKAYSGITFSSKSQSNVKCQDTDQESPLPCVVITSFNVNCESLLVYIAPFLGSQFITPIEFSSDPSNLIVTISIELTPFASLISIVKLCICPASSCSFIVSNTRPLAGIDVGSFTAITNVPISWSKPASPPYISSCPA